MTARIVCGITYGVTEDVTEVDASLEDMITYQLVFGIKDNRIQTHLLSEADGKLSLQAVELATFMETAAKNEAERQHQWIGPFTQCSQWRAAIHL